MSEKILTDADVAPTVPGTYAMLVAPQIVARYPDLNLADVPQSSGYLTVKPDNPPKYGEEQFVILTRYQFATAFEVEPMAEMRLLNAPPATFAWPVWGGGLGVGPLKDTQIRARLAPRGVQAEALEFNGWAGAPDIFDIDGALVVSPKVLSILQDFNIDKLDVLPVQFTKDSSPDFAGYAFIDVLGALDAYDYERCSLMFCREGERIFGTLGDVRAFRRDLPKNLHLFHDLYGRQDFIISRELARRLHDEGVRGLCVRDPATWDDFFLHERLVAEYKAELDRG